MSDIPNVFTKAAIFSAPILRILHFFRRPRHLQHPFHHDSPRRQVVYISRRDPQGKRNHSPQASRRLERPVELTRPQRRSRFGGTCDGYSSDSRGLEEKHSVRSFAADHRITRIPQTIGRSLEDHRAKPRIIALAKPPKKAGSIRRPPDTGSEKSARSGHERESELPASRIDSRQKPAVSEVHAHRSVSQSHCPGYSMIHVLIILLHSVTSISRFSPS